jgi:microsomal dipeptidase-like Zn-dependent dipeptidase
MRRRPLIVTLLLVAAIYILTPLVSYFAESRYNKVMGVGRGVSPAAARLHGSLLICDMHADSLIWGRNLRQRSGVGQVDIPRLRAGHVTLQIFTVPTTVPRGLNMNRNAATTDMIRYLALVDHWPPTTWSSPKQRALYQAERLMRLSDSADIAMVKRSSDLQSGLAARAERPRQILAVLGLEGAQPLEGDLKNLDALYQAGYRMIAPTHFTDTELAGAAAGVTKTGLTETGRAWVKAMEAKHMLIDLAHASSETIRDVTALATRPLVVSHTGVKGTCKNNRNLSDEEIRAVAKTGGVIGIGYWQAATCGRDAAAVARAIRYAVNIAGVEHVGLGSDFDGGVTMPFDTSGLAQVTDALLSAGFTEREIRLIEGENVLRVLKEVLPPN